MARHRTRQDDTRLGLKEGPTLLRIFGLIMCGGLLTASFWLTGPSNAQDPSQDEGNPFERFRQASQPAVQQPPASSPSEVPDANRRRVQDTLRQARQKWEQGQAEEAQRLAFMAAQMAGQMNVTFAPGEQTPQQLLALMQNAGGGRPAETPVPAAPEEKLQFVQNLLMSAQRDIQQGNFDAARMKVERAQQIHVVYGVFDLRPEHVLAELARHQPARPQGPSDSFETFAQAEQTPPSVQKPAAVRATQPVSEKERALSLVADAKQALEQGHVKEARQLALEAQQVDVAWGLFDERPELVLAEIERRTNTEIFAASPESKPATESGSKSPAGQGRAAALALLKDARDLLEAGQLDAARLKAVEAQKLDVAYGLFDDTPDLVLQEVRTLQARRMTDQPAEPSFVQTPPAAGQTQQKQLALGMLRQARDAMRGGDLDHAEQHLRQAENLDVAYSLFDDRPEVVREDLDRLIAARGKPQSNPFNLAQTSEGKTPLEAQKPEATRLLESARQDLEAGNLQAAREKVQTASQLDVTYDLFEDSPEQMLAEIDRAVSRGASVAGISPWAGPGTGNSENQQPQVGATDPEFTRPDTGAPLDLTEATSAPRGTSTGSVANRDSLIVTSDGISAQESFNKGVEHLRQGDREAAYEAFLQAYHSADKLDPYRQQQLQDKLRELAPRRRSQAIQQASNETVERDGNVGSLSQQGRIDAVVQDQALKFDRLRTDSLNAIFRAEKLREKKPDEALQLLNDTLTSIRNSGLSEQQTASLTASVENARASVQAYMAQKAPILELERKNVETKDLINREIQTRVRIEQELADLVDKFNTLMDQRHYPAAHAVAKQAKALDPENPVTVNMELKSMFAMRHDRIEKLKSDKEGSFWHQLQDVEEAVVNPLADGRPIAYAANWDELKKKRGPRPADAREYTPTELRVKQSLLHPVSLHFDNAPLTEVMRHIAVSQGINVVVDDAGLAEEGVMSSTPVSISVDGIQLRSALNLLLHPLNLDYTIENEVLNVTSRLRQQGDLVSRVYQVADLVVPISIRPQSSGMQPGANRFRNAADGGLQSIPGIGVGNGLAQIPAQPMGGGNPLGGNLPGMPRRSPSSVEPAVQSVDFKSLSDLITHTVSPESWFEIGGPGTIDQHESTLSLVVRQTQRVHQEIADLLEQLRRLQDLQVTIEVRFISVSDEFFEQIGIDFDFNVNDTIGGPRVNDDFTPVRPFGSTDPEFGALGGTTGTAGMAGMTGTTLQGLAPFGPQPTLNLMGRDRWPSRTVVGLVNNTETFSPELDIPFRQGSFDLAAPTFGGFDANAGLQFGMAILSDIEAFMFVRAAQGDRRSNVMFAPKLTLFNGQMGNVFSGALRPFVVSLTPVASAFSIGFRPEIQEFFDGTSLTVLAVISADRRYVRLSMTPTFSNITDVFTFSFISGGAGAGAAGGMVGGGGGIGGGIGGGGGVGGGIGGGIGGGAAGGAAGGAGAAGTVTVQQPVTDQFTVDTVVSVPDGGTVLLGGMKTLREGRNMAGVPILNKIPYISRLFKNTGVGRETSSMMMMVTPRIIIQEEEEELLGIPN